MLKWNLWLITYSYVSNIFNATPLHCAANNGYEEIIKLLLEHENIDIDAKDEILIYLFLIKFSKKTPHDLPLYLMQ